MYFCLNCGFCESHCECPDFEDDIQEVEDAEEEDCPACLEELEAIENGEWKD